MYTIKQVILARKDLNMRKGKFAAQVAHASMKVFLDRKVDNVVGYIVRDDSGNETTVRAERLLVIPCTEMMWAWVQGVFAKVVLTVEGAQDLFRVRDLAEGVGLPTALITDNGYTEFHGVHTNTAVAIGPAKVEDIDRITGPEGLVKTQLA